MVMLTPAGQAAARPAARVSSSSPISTAKIVMPAMTMMKAICRVLRHSRVSHIRAMRSWVLAGRAGRRGFRFGALILFQEGRKYCPDLARIIETVPAAVGTAAFSTALRERIVHHFDNCRICDDCRTCNAKRRELVGPYVPGLIPILFAAGLRDRLTDIIDRITEHAEHHTPGERRSGAAVPGVALVADATAVSGRTPSSSRSQPRRHRSPRSPSSRKVPRREIRSG